MILTIKWLSKISQIDCLLIDGRLISAQVCFDATLPLLYSEPQAMCYTETSNLDGETNLKIRQVGHRSKSLRMIPLVPPISQCLDSTCGHCGTSRPQMHSVKTVCKTKDLESFWTLIIVLKSC